MSLSIPKSPLLLKCPRILRRAKRVRVEAKGFGGVKRPVRLAQRLASQQNDVGLRVADDGVGLHRVGNQADGGDTNLRAAFYGFGEWHLIARRDWDAGVRYVSAR